MDVLTLDEGRLSQKRPMYTERGLKEALNLCKRDPQRRKKYIKRDNTDNAHQKRPTKETCKRDLQKRQYRQSTSKETEHVLNYIHQKTLYIYIKRDLQKRPTKETQTSPRDL